MEFGDLPGEWETAREREAAGGADFGLNRTVHAGWRLEQDANRSFAPANDNSKTDWTVADGVQNISAFELNVNRTKLYDGTDTSAFRLNVSDGTTDWELYIYQDSAGDINVSECNPTDSSSENCSLTADRAVIDLRNETLAGNDCSALDFSSAVSGPLEVRYENVNVSVDARVNGTYRVVINGSDAVATDGSDEPKRFDATGGSAPTATAVVYAVSYDTHYRRNDVVHDRAGRYAPRAEAY